MDFRDVVLQHARGLAAQHIAPPSAEYNAITEGRGDWKKDGVTKKYSWCGDFVTYCLMLAGADNYTHYLNRCHFNGKWVIGKNIDYLARAGSEAGTILKGAAAVAAMQSQDYRGSVLIIDAANGGHVCIFDRAADSNTYVSQDGNTIGGRTDQRIRSFSESKVIALIPCATFTKGLGKTVITEGYPSGMPIPVTTPPGLLDVLANNVTPDQIGYDLFEGNAFDLGSIMFDDNSFIESDSILGVYDIFK